MVVGGVDGCASRVSGQGGGLGGGMVVVGPETRTGAFCSGFREQVVVVVEEVVVVGPETRPCACFSMAEVVGR